MGVNCHDKCVEFLRRCNADESVDAFAVLGRALSDYMEAIEDYTGRVQPGRDRINAILTRYSLRYEQGGHVRGALQASPSRSFEDLLRRHDFTTVEVEFKRAIENVETDPAAALTAACATLESICQIYIEDEGLAMPARRTLGDLWPVVKASLNFDPRSVADDDLRRILGGIASIVDGIAAFRTHAGSAHGRGRTTYRVQPRHARLPAAMASQMRLAVRSSSLVGRPVAVIRRPPSTTTRRSGFGTVRHSGDAGFLGERRGRVGHAFCETEPHAGSLRVGVGPGGSGVRGRRVHEHWLQYRRWRRLRRLRDQLLGD